jgi:hypothetical protein
MTTGQMLYLIMVIAAFLSFAAGLMWAMLSAGRPDRSRPVGSAQTREAAGAARGHWSHGAG